MINAKAVAALRQRVADTSIVDRIAELDLFAASLPFHEFREPVAITELGDKGRNRLLNLDSRYLTGWSHHMAYSMRVRLRSLEPGIVEELAAGRALAPQVLLRSHLEASAMAALSLETLMKRDVDELSRLIPQTLFGTALFNKSNGDDRVEAMLSYGSQRTITIKRAIDALQRFGNSDGGDADTSIAYALLCEAAHPNHGGTRQFVRTSEVDERGEYGWHVTYSEHEAIASAHTEKLAELLLFSMRSGYAATELLRNMHISETKRGVVIHGVSEKAARKIWLNVLQKEMPPDV